MPSLVPKGKQGLLKQLAHSTETEGSKHSAAGGRLEFEELQAPVVVGLIDDGSDNEPSMKGTSTLGDKGTRVLVDKGASQPAAKRTDYEKKGYYVGLRHQDTLDDLAKALRRYGLPDDRSMIVRSLIDAAAQRLQTEGAAWLTELAAVCRETLPGTTKKPGN